MGIAQCETEDVAQTGVRCGTAALLFSVIWTRLLTMKYGIF
jgi:hypothetical protein